MSTRKFRIILLLLLMTGFVSTINAQEQKISLSLNNATLRQFFNEIEHKTDYSFSYREGVLDNRKDITVSAQNKDLLEVLKAVLTPRGLSFSIQSKSVVIIPQQQVAASKPVIIKERLQMLPTNHLWELPSGLKMVMKAQRPIWTVTTQSS